MASEVKSITSEALEAAYRALTPSQSGFTQDLMASNTIIPVLDLTSSAEGSTVSENLQTALAFGSQTSFAANNQTTGLANTAGFWRIFGTASGTPSSSIGGDVHFDLSDGLSNKTIWQLEFRASADQPAVSESFDFVVFLRSGDSLAAVSTAVNFKIQGSYRQIADVNGVLVNPSGFTPQ